jgi:hypothetical protein
MDLDWSATDLAFCDEVQGFLDEKLTPALRQGVDLFNLANQLEIVTRKGEEMRVEGECHG